VVLHHRLRQPLGMTRGAPIQGLIGRMPNSRAGACEGRWTELYTILYKHRSMSSLMNIDHVVDHFGDLAIAPD
jgi:hypothetical protein